MSMRCVSAIRVLPFVLLSLAFAGPGSGDKLAAEAERILQNVKTTEYAHKTDVDEQAGSYKLDCSGLVCLALKKANPDALKAVPKTGTEKRAFAHDFYDCFTAAPISTQAPADAKWVRIAKLADAQPGDVIAWKNENYQPGENTGHVMIIMEAPVPDGDGILKVVVIDSSAHGHGSDTRKKGESGVGRGTLWFSVGKDGEPIGVRFSSRTGALNPKIMAIGRLQ
jgi:hypothetical protein